MILRILNWKTGGIIFEGDYPNMKSAVEAAVKQNVSLAFADLAEEILTGANLTGGDFAGADLTDINLIGANLAWTNLTGANFRDANLTGVMFYMANLTGVNFEGANLTGANFKDSTFVGANFYSAILTNTDITDTNLEELKFERVILTDTNPKKTIKYKTVKMIDGDDWDSLVMQTYQKPYCLQQQNYGMRGLVEITVPPDDLDDFPNDTLEESQYAMGVSFKAWLEKDPNEISDRFQRELFWGRKFYPELNMVVNDLYEKGLLEEGEYEIDIDW